MAVEGKEGKKVHFLSLSLSICAATAASIFFSPYVESSRDGVAALRARRRERERASIWGIFPTLS